MFDDAHASIPINQLNQTDPCYSTQTPSFAKAWATNDTISIQLEPLLEKALAGIILLDHLHANAVGRIGVEAHVLGHVGCGRLPVVVHQLANPISLLMGNGRVVPGHFAHPHTVALLIELQLFEQQGKRVSFDAVGLLLQDHGVNPPTSASSRRRLELGQEDSQASWGTSSTTHVSHSAPA